VHGSSFYCLKKEKTELHQKDLEQLGNYMIKGGGHGSKE
jgi:hypothetical protein